MKQRNTGQRHRHPEAAASAPAKVQQEADFTAEGSPPPGKVGSERPALPEDRLATRRAVAGEHGKR